VGGYTFLNWGVPRSIFQIAPSEARAFFSHLFSMYASEGQGVMMAAEVDFLNWSQLTIPALFSVLDGGHEYLAGFAAAAQANGLSHQLCMALPSQVMSSLLLPSLTNARASPDNTPTNEHRWKIGYTSLLMWPLQIAPFFDNVWTTSIEPSEPYGPGVQRHNVQLQYMLTVLTAGPVGIADQINTTNSTRTLQSCTSNGTLLQPDKPSTPIDAMFAASSSADLPVGEIWQTHARIGSLVWRYISAVDVSEPYSLRRAHVWPADQDAHLDTLVMPWHSRQACSTATPPTTTARNTSLPDGCARFWSGSGGSAATGSNVSSDALEVQTTPMVGLEHGFDLFVVAPIARSVDGRGVALLGEIGKIVSVSSNRFADAATDATGMAVVLNGGAHEVVDIVWYTFRGRRDATCTRHTQRLELDRTGNTTAHLPFDTFV
jgi:hypothetical protein